MNKDIPRANKKTMSFYHNKLYNFEKDLVTRPNTRFRSYMIIKDGEVKAEKYFAPYEKNDKQSVYSMSKGFASTAVGIAQDEEILDVDNLIYQYFENEIEAMEDGENKNRAKKIKIKHLLTMSTGHNEHILPKNEDEIGSFIKAFFSNPFVYEPGEKFVYNSFATYMLSVIIQKITNETLHEYIDKRLLSKTGIKNTQWEKSPEGYCAGGWGIHVSTEDIGKLCLLYLNNGICNNERLLSEKWITEATKKHIDNKTETSTIDWSLGYGYQFWRGQHGHYRIDGAYGQFGIIFPEENMIVVITQESNDGQGTLDTIYEHVPRIFFENSAFETNKSDILHLDKSYKIEDNPENIKEIALKLDNDFLEISFDYGDKKEIMLCGKNKFIRNTLLPPIPLTTSVSIQKFNEQPVEIAAKYKIINNIIKIKYYFILSTHRVNMNLEFKNNFDIINISFDSSIKNELKTLTALLQDGFLLKGKISNL